MTELHCVRGCTRRDRHLTDCDGHCPGCEPRRADHGGLCNTCIGKLDEWLGEIPDRYALLPTFLLPSADREKNPESKATKRTTAPVPVRVDVLDLMDTRRGRRWLGLVPTEDRRGTVGTLLAIGNELRTQPHINGTVIGEAAFIQHSLIRLASNPGIYEIFDELRILHSQLGDAIGVHKPRPVGVCAVIRNSTGEACGGNIMPSDTGGAYCKRCNAKWSYDNLRFLGTLIEEPA